MQKRIAVVLLAAGMGCTTMTPGGEADGVIDQAQGGGGGGAMQVATTGLFVIDNPGPGEPAISGLVLAALSGSHATPPDTVVTLNGVRLVPAGGNASYFTVSPAGPQPALGADGFLHLVASSASAGSSRTLDLACPARVSVTADPALGASLAGVATLTLAWTGLPQNAPNLVNLMLGPTAALYAYDLATNTLGSAVGFQVLSQASTGATLTVAPTGSSNYLAELRYPGVYLLDGNSGGVCDLALRFPFAN